MNTYDPKIFYRLGRREAQETVCRLWWSGCGVRFEAACGYINVEAGCFAPDFAAWLGVMVDGAPVARLPLLPGRRVYTVLAGMDPQVTHEVTLFRDSEPTGDEKGPVELYGLETDGTLRPVPGKKRLIEFIGDSLTAGEGCLGARSIQGEWRMAYASHMASFPAMTAGLLDAEARVVGVGGWGVWRSWDDNPDHVLGKIYDRLCPLNPEGDRPYDFGGREADAVVINLGTNDSGPRSRAEDRPAAEESFIACAKALLAQVRFRQPRAHILWAYGLLGTDMAPLIARAVSEYRAGGEKNVSFLLLTDCAGDFGANLHPSRAAHLKAAQEIAAYLETALPDAAS